LPSADSEPLLPTHGGYRSLKSFQVAQLVYDLTARFTERYVDRRSRTRDQMIQAARSGVQNIAEGSQASGTSKKTEIRLTNVARASLEELRLDYEDFLRQRGLLVWERSDQRRQELIDRRCGSVEEVVDWVAWVREGGRSGRGGRGGPEERMSSERVPTYAEIAANGALTLLAVACALLDRQLRSLAEVFETEGGFTERLYRVRTARRKASQRKSTTSTQSTGSTKSTNKKDQFHQ
jgi:four helix bundle suffix protein